MKLHDYLQTPAYFEQALVQKEFQVNEAPTPSRTFESNSKVWRIAKEVLYALGAAFLLYSSFYLLGSYFTIFQTLGLPTPFILPAIPLTFVPLSRWAHSLPGSLIVPASSYTHSELSPFRKNLKEVCNRLDFQIKRFSIQVDGEQIDAVMLGKIENLQNGRWTLVSGGNGECYEYSTDDSLMRLLNHLGSNAIVFNYPGVGASSGKPNRDLMIGAYEALLKVLEEDIQAKTIFGYGHSIGGGVQAEALKGHQFKSGVKYLSIKSRSFSDLSETAANLMFKPLDLLVRLLGWNLETAKCSKELTKCPELILQTAKSSPYSEISRLEDIVHDEIIDPSHSLAAKLLKDKPSHKYLMGIPDYHNDGLSKESCAAISKKAEEMLQAFSFN